jgi:hypothetical protein
MPNLVVYYTHNPPKTVVKQTKKGDKGERKVFFSFKTNKAETARSATWLHAGKRERLGERANHAKA